MTNESESTDESDENISRLREMATYGREYSEINEYEYFGGELALSVSPLDDEILIPFSAVLEEKFEIDDIEEASDEIDDAREEGDIDPSKVDASFVNLMADVCVHGVNTDEGDAEGETEQGLKEIFGVADNEEDNIGLVGGMTLEVSQDILDISSDAESAESFRR